MTTFDIERFDPNTGFKQTITFTGELSDIPEGWNKVGSLKLDYDTILNAIRYNHFERDIFLDLWRDSGALKEQLTADDHAELFATSCLGASDLTKDTLDSICSDYSVDNLLIIDKNNNDTLSQMKIVFAALNDAQSLVSTLPEDERKQNCEKAIDSAFNSFNCLIGNCAPEIGKDPISIASQFYDTLKFIPQSVIDILPSHQLDELQEAILSRMTASSLNDFDALVQALQFVEAEIDKLEALAQLDERQEFALQHLRDAKHYINQALNYME